MRLYIARPNPLKPAPCVMVFHEAFGLTSHIKEVVERIAKLGFVAAAPELFHRTAPGFQGDYNDLGKSKPHMDVLTNDKLEADIWATYDWFHQDVQANTQSLAVVGFCLGGKAAFIANVILPLKAASSFYGSSIPPLLPLYACRQKSPLLLIWGGHDKHIDASKRANIAHALKVENKIFTQVEFSQAGHGFFCDDRKTYDPQAAREAWVLLSMFLKNKIDA